MVKIARVFPTKTKMSPIDTDAYFSSPNLTTPFYDEVYISVTFTWDINKAKDLAIQWRKFATTVKIGGPALGDHGGDIFVPGMYLKHGVTITSRGCPNKCSFCLVPNREGRIRELAIRPGNIIQDNNLLACSTQHIKKVFRMLRTQHHINFSGGFEASRVTDEIVNELLSLRIYQIWLSYDTPGREIELIKAVERLKKYFPRDKIRCYVLTGYKNDTLIEAEKRLRWAYSIGTLPFAMRYSAPEPELKGTYLYKERSWNLSTRQWTRPAIIKTIMKSKT